MTFSFDFRSALAVLAVGVAGLLVLPAQAAPKRAEIAYVPVGSNPAVPAGLKVTCMQGPTVLTSSKTCPVVKYQGNTTWAYSFIDNRVSLALVTYDAQGNVLSNVTKDGARYVWEAVVNPGEQTITFSGQSNQTVSASYADITPPPQVVTVASNSNPPVPAGLKVTCMTSGTTLSSSPTCPVVKYMGITTWAYSFIDNRVALALVSYDANNNVVRNTAMSGTRYVWQIAVNPGSSEVTFTGQSNATVTAPFTQFGP